MQKNVLRYLQVLRQDRIQGGLIQRLSDVIKDYSNSVSAHIWVTNGLTCVPAKKDILKS